MKILTWRWSRSCGFCLFLSLNNKQRCRPTYVAYLQYVFTSSLLYKCRHICPTYLPLTQSHNHITQWHCLLMLVSNTFYVQYLTSLGLWLSEGLIFPSTIIFSRAVKCWNQVLITNQYIHFFLMHTYFKGSAVLHILKM